MTGSDEQPSADRVAFVDDLCFAYKGSFLRFVCPYETRAASTRHMTVKISIPATWSQSLYSQVIHE